MISAALGRPPLRSVFGDPTPSGQPMLTLSDVSVHFGGVAALTGLSFTVDANDMVAVIGPNGAGKSTLLNAISGLVRATGTVRLAGTRLDRLSPARVVAAGVGRSFQDAPMIEAATVLENVLCGAFPALPYGLVRQLCTVRSVARQERVAAEKAMTLLSFAGLDDVANQPAGDLSYGARKRVDIARAMVSGPSLLLLDEPSSGLDGGERVALERMLSVLRAEECVTTLYVEHHMDLVRRTATRVAALKAGELVMFDRPEVVLDAPRLDDLSRGVPGEHDPSPDA